MPAIEPQSRDDRRWNFWAALIDAGGWGLGMGMISPTTILPLFVSQLTTAPIALGMIQTVMLLGWLGPGVLVSPRIDRLPRVKATVMSIAIIERMIMLMIAGFCLWLGPKHQEWLLVAFFACWLVMNTSIGVNTPAYYKLIAKTIPAESRGRLYGIGGAVSGLLGIGGANAAGWLLSTWRFPAGYAACFVAAFVLQTVTVLPLATLREPRQAGEEVSTGARAAWNAMREVVRDRRLTWLAVALALFAVNQAAPAFYTAYAVHRFGATTEAVAGFTAVLMGGRTLGFLLFGWMGDHFGNRAPLVVSSIFGALAAALAFAAPGMGWFYPVFALNEAAAQGWGVCSINYVLELCPPERSGTYVAVFGMLTGPFRVFLPLVGGFVVAGAGYPAVFAAAAVGALIAGAVMLARVPEPRQSTPVIR